MSSDFGKINKKYFFEKSLDKRCATWYNSKFVARAM